MPASKDLADGQLRSDVAEVIRIACMAHDARITDLLFEHFDIRRYPSPIAKKKP